MTREKAIAWFEFLKKGFANTEYEEYLNLAITALSTEGEYIKKSDLMAKVVTETLSDYTEEDVIYVDVINQLPTYSFPDREKGEWIEHEPFEKRNCNICIECSVCHTWFGHDCYEKTNFCPNCGADMRGKAE